jgi:histidyl-tRNA synthetase
LREFWQLNADLIGYGGIEADAEIIAVAHNLVRSFGAEERDFEIRVSDRRLVDSLFDGAGIPTELRPTVTRLLDRRAKMENFSTELGKVLHNQEQADALLGVVDRTTSSAYLEELRLLLAHMGVGNMIVDVQITRGFDYYTGMVFEVFDTDPANRRSLMGGGRYDNLLSNFGVGNIPAVGFAMGDVVARDFLESHNLLPVYTPATEVMLAVVDNESLHHALRLAHDLRREDVCVSINFTGKRIGDQIRVADKAKIPFVIVVGTNERTTGRYVLKNIGTGSEITLPADRIAEHLFGALG